MKSETKNCQNCKKSFTIEPEDFNFYEKIKVPPPTFCFQCRLQRKLLSRNERNLYKEICGSCKKSILTMYRPESNMVSYCKECWWSDKWDALDFGKGFEFKDNFFQQLMKLQKNVPVLALSNVNSINSEYCNFADGNKGCYLLFGSGFNENVNYSKTQRSKDSSDIYLCNKCELSYDCINCSGSYHLLFSNNCKNCVDSYFLLNCRNCNDCFGCANLVSKSFCIFNQQYSKEEYQKIIEDFKLDDYNHLKNFTIKINKEIFNKAIRQYGNITASTQVTGDNISNSKNCKHSFDLLQGVEDSKYLYFCMDLKNSYDSVGQYKNELGYENVDGNIGNLNFSTITVYDSTNVKYSKQCYNCNYLFGCIGLRNKQYCILNKQYSKEEYFKKIELIKSGMETSPYKDKRGIIYKYGEFFPPELSPFSYNETLAQEHLPLNKELALKQGYKWKDKEERNYTIDITSKDIPDDIKDVDESIINKVIECEHSSNNEHPANCGASCTEAFKIIESELQFYQRMNLPLPHLCPNCRHYQRLKQRNPLKLWHRTCMCGSTGSPQATTEHFHGKGKCEVEFETSYAPDRPEVVYCERCYQQEVY